MEGIINFNSPVFFIILVWSTIWKGIALWRAAKYEQKNWFITILVINTIGILELIYLFRFCKHRLKIEELFIWKNLK